MSNNISLSIDHPNAGRMAFFLNHVEEPLKEAVLHWRTWKMADRITDACKFISVSDDPVSITVIFCDSYADANEIAKVNALPDAAKAKWSVNGNVLYLVESADENKVSEVLSLFAGKE